ncbi:glucosamine-6-phosphate deaminase [Nitratireductor basaltis]|uniref:Glucosamine-6-phosphate deaminase n=1 Tax=Nitratireductor basaltis TaxID=472175 RepID=A0A084U8M2_9HYPH|nr:glucosamine-6-phosphate deaminase [Nitratireductor basaltis]KFB09308.1 Glucosamine-6-phosphate isomerase [Nitratireductor basaltis]
MATILIHPDTQSAIRATAERLLQAVQGDHDAVLGLATGGTMEPVYHQLVRRADEARLSFAGVTTFNLDEYVGLAADHPQSYRSTMNRLLFDHVDIPRNQTYLPRGDAQDPSAEAIAYEAAIEAAGGIDLQLLGIGRNGHLGFNEPSSSLASRTRIKKLARSTLEANARFFGAGERMPTHAITMGIGTIMKARKLLMLAMGASKADAVAAALEGPVTAACPASILQFHPDVTVVLDQEAASCLKLRDFYEDIHPGGQEVYFAGNS